MKRTHLKFDLEITRNAARGQWPAIISCVGGIASDLLDGSHHPCPECGGKDRFRMIDADAGACLCNQCFNRNNGDGFATLAWRTKKSFPGVLADVAGYLGIQPIAGDQTANGNTPVNPVKDLDFQPWNDLLVATWCVHKPGVTPAAVQAIGGRIAKYKGRYSVLAIPVHGLKLAAVEPVGWVLYNLAGGTLPKWPKEKGGKIEWVKVKLTHGSQRGIIADLSRLPVAATLWKLEGPSDLLAMLSLADLPADVCPITNAHGSKENCPEWASSLFAGKIARVLHDADIPGEDGAAGWTDHKGLFRLGWAQVIAAKATECRHVRLPYTISPDHGKDLRDWINEGKTYVDLIALTELAGLISGNTEIKVNKAVDDPDRLARINLENYAKIHREATLRYWRGEWYKYTGTHYKKIKVKELAAKIGASIQTEFDRANIEEQKLGGKDGEEPPVAKKVTVNLINNVIQATAALVVISDSVELNTWLDRENNSREPRRFVAMKNGILDLECLLAGNDDDDLSDILQPHSSKWFSTFCLPYDFNPDAKCPKWMAFLDKNLEGDQERIRILQEWAGYCLLPDTSYQKFLALEGEGSNGKSVYMAGLTAIVGQINCSAVPLEQFGNPFSKTSMLGKLLNISADTAELDKICEGYLKSFASGDIMNFDRKHIDAIDVIPTARLVISFNNRPRFSDRSSGIIRRMLLVPWNLEMLDHEKVLNMDKAWWWEQSGDLSGMFLWAVIGLARLRQQNKFSRSEVCDKALANYRREGNPAREFLLDCCEENSLTSVSCRDLYAAYRKWVADHGNMPLAESQFGKEVSRVFKTTKRTRSGTRTDRQWNYHGINFLSAENSGEKNNVAF